MQLDPQSNRPEAIEAVYNAFQRVDLTNLLAGDPRDLFLALADALEGEERELFMSASSTEVMAANVLFEHDREVAVRRIELADELHHLIDQHGGDSSEPGFIERLPTDVAQRVVEIVATLDELRGAPA